MKTLKLSLLASAMILGSFAVKAQSADEIINKHIAAVGGADNWKKVSSVKRSGTVNLQGNEAKLTISQAQNKGFRMDLDLDLDGMAINNYVIITQTEGWQFFPIGGQTSPQAMSAEQVKESQESLNLTDEILQLKTKGTKVSYVGKEQVDGKECHKLSYPDKDGDPVNLYFDASTNYLVKKTEVAEIQPGQKMEIAATYSDYKKLPEGIAIAMSGSDPNMGDFTFNSVEVNKGVDDNTFKAKQ